MNERDQAFGKFNLLQKEVSHLNVKFSSHKFSLNEIVGGYVIDTDYVEMNLDEAKVLVDSLIKLQLQIRSKLKEISFYKDKFGFEE